MVENAVASRVRTYQQETLAAESGRVEPQVATAAWDAGPRANFFDPVRGWTNCLRRRKEPAVVHGGIPD